MDMPTPAHATGDAGEPTGHSRPADPYAADTYTSAADSIAAAHADPYAADTYTRAADPYTRVAGSSPAPDEHALPRRELPEVAPDRYAMAGELARGGLGSVWLAHDRVLDRTVALKRLLRTNPVTRARFLREIWFTARLQHPGIVPIYDAGRASDGEPFYAMKRVGGRTLTAAIAAAGTLPARLALLSHVQAAADAIAYTHDQHIIHRDLKPHNILVGDFGETIIIDWGVAKDLRSGEPDPLDSMEAMAVSDLTSVGAIVGTPAYMPPEQARGEALDERADVYALGATLYHTLAGTPPYTGDARDTIAALRSRGAPRALELRAPETPIDLLSIVAKAMAPRREDRYPSAKELAHDLHRFTTGQLIGARRYSLRELLRRWLARNRRVVAVAVAAIVALLVLAVASARNILEARNRAQQARTVAEARSDALTLAQARTGLRTDPTEAAAWIATYPVGAADWDQAFALTQRIEAAGVARHVFKVNHLDCSGLVFTNDHLHLLADAGPFGLEVRALATGLRTAWHGRTHGIPVADMLVTFDDQARIAVTRPPDGPLQLLATLAGPVELLAPAPGAGFVVAGLTDGRLAAIDLRSGAVTAIAGHRGRITALYIEPDDDHIVSVAVDGALRRASLREVNSVVVTRGAAPLTRVVPLPGGSRALLGDDEGGIFEVDLKTTDQPHPAPVVRLAAAIASLHVSADGRHLAATDREGHLHVRARSSGRTLEPPWSAQRSFGLRFAPEEPVLAVTGHDGALHLWNLDTDDHVTRFGDPTTFAEPAFAGDGSSLATCSMNGAARVWPAPDLRGRLLRGHRSQVAHALFLPDGRLATDSGDTTVRLWDPSSGASTVLTGHRETVYGLALRPDGQRFASAGFDGFAHVWDLGTATGVRLSGHEGRVRTVAWLPDGHTVVTAGDDGTIRVWEEDGRARTVLRGHVGNVAWLVVTADGDLVSTGADGTLRRWSLADGSQQILGRDLNTADDPNFRVALVADGHAVAACHGPDAISVWPLDGGAPRVFPAGQRLGCTRIVAAADGRKLAIPGVRDVLLLDLDRGAWSRLGSHDDEPHSLQFSPDSRLLASAGLDRTARLWRLSDGAAAIVHLAESAVLGVDFSSDGRTLAATSVDASVWVGPIDEARLVPATPAELHTRLTTLTTAALLPTGGVAGADGP